MSIRKGSDSSRLVQGGRRIRVNNSQKLKIVSLMAKWKNRTWHWQIERNNSENNKKPNKRNSKSRLSNISWMRRRRKEISRSKKTNRNRGSKLKRRPNNSIIIKCWPRRKRKRRKHNTRNGKVFSKSTRKANRRTVLRYSNRRRNSYQKTYYWR